MELWQLTATQLRAAYDGGETTPSEVVTQLLARIERIDPAVGAFRQILADEALVTAQRQTKELAGGEPRPPLHGIPIGIKELFDVAGANGSYGSEVLSGRISAADATAVERLRSAGAVIIGTTRSHEFGWGITTQNERLGSTYNPWDTSRTPGGSSGGSAAAVALGMIPLALGSDTGGSIRIPACFCGVVGFKPTYGRVSKRGAVALAPSLDHPGPIARSVADLAMAMAAMAGVDPVDPTTIAEPPPTANIAPVDLGSSSIGVCPDLHITELRPDHQRQFDAAIAALAGLGATIVEVPMPDAAGIRPTFGTIQMAEAHYVHTVTLGTYPKDAAEYGADVRHRLEMASEVTIDDYLGARAEAGLVDRRFQQLFDDVDVLVTPITAGGPSTVASPDRSPHEDPIPFRDLVMDYTVPQDLAHLPACAVRNGFDADGLPIGIQFTGPLIADERVLGIAAAFTEATRPDIDWPALAFP